MPATPGALEALARELTAADLAELLGSAPSFAPVLTLTDACIRAPVGYACEDCCHWSLPLAAPYAGRETPNGAAMHYPEWLTWHYHVIRHQQHDRIGGSVA